LKDSPNNIENIEVGLGGDGGSLSTNLVLIDKDNNIIARRYLMTEGRPIEAVRRGLQEFEDKVGQKVIVKAVGSTGSGRYLTGELIGADVIRNEITAQATAAIAIDPNVDTIFEIGGQDSKYISIDNKAVIDFEMNKACAAGTGSFLQEQAEKLDINIETEFAEKALCSTCPVGCGERCTVFMESDLVSHQRKGAQKDDILAGLAYSIAGNYLTKVVGDRRVGSHIFFQGGVAWNKAVVAAFEKLIGKNVTVPPHHDVTGAIGAALLAREKLNGSDYQTKFKGFDFYKRHYDLDSFVCEDCSNQCEIHTVEIEGEEPLYYGSRCEKYEVETHDEINPTKDYFTLRQKHLSKRYIEPSKTKRHKVVGLPRVLHFYEYYPFWKGFFESLGYDVISSDKSNQIIVENALELFTAETCYPIKIVYGHIANLLNKKPDIIFLPSLIKVTEEDDINKTGAFICPYVQTVGSALKTKFDFKSKGIDFINSSISLNQNITDLKQSMSQLAQDLNLSVSEFDIGLSSGLSAFKQFKQRLKDEGKRILSEIDQDEKTLIIISRPYSSYDRKLSLELPDKIRRLGVKAIPLDFLPIGDGNGDYPFMYWRYGKKILTSADYIRNHPNLFAVYISSFGCGPDSFITHFFRKAMSDKPYLQLELDEHSADAGLITRIEAFMDSLRHYKFKPPISSFTIASEDFKPFEKTIYIPNMCDHAIPVRASFEKYGLKAEVLDEPDNTTLDIGKKFTSGKECFPCILTTGDMIKKINGDNFNRDKTIFFMPGAGGPCRFGLYSQFHRMVLADLGYNDIPILSPNSENGYANFGLNKTDFRKTAWQGLLFVDCLIKLLHNIRPYEKNSGEAEHIYYKYLNRLDHAIVNKLSLKKLGTEAAGKFAEINVRSCKKPVVGVVGEIYLRNNRYSNNHLISNLEKLGMEVWLAPFAEWLLYTSTTYKRDSLIERNIKGILQSTSQLVIQKWHEKHILNAFGKKYDIRHDYPIGRVLDYASKYLPIDYKGEAVLSIGKSIEMVNEGASGIINAMPFNCMPGTVVSSLSKKISDDLGEVPWLNISYEGLRDSGEETRLEAFAEQVKANSKYYKEYSHS
jgi:predicted CoA-substrate-specific enzyme activase